MVFRTFTQTYDMNTEQDAPVLLGIHTPIGGDAVKFLRPFYQAYRKFKYLGADVTIVNAARLPVDPEQIGKIEGTNYVDPRDTLNPMMFKGCHGESLGNVLNSMYGGLTTDIFKASSMDKETFKATLEDFYYTALGDDAWRKAPIQKTLRIKGLHPLVYNLATNHQIGPNESIGPSDYAENGTSYNALNGPDSAQSGRVSQYISDVGRPFVVTPSDLLDPSTDTGVKRYLTTMFTNKCQRLGWMDTMQTVGAPGADQDTFGTGQVAALPKLFMGILMLPPSYLCRQYLRVIITHKFKFSGYRTITTGAGTVTFGNGQKQGVGYIDALTGNISTSEGSKKVVDEIDYDAIEEVDDDGSCE